MRRSAPLTGLIAVAHDLRSMHNVGAIFRTAEGAGFEELILSGFTGWPPDPRISKVALGAEEYLPHRRADSLEDLLQMLDGVHVVVLEQTPSSQPPSELKLPEEGRVALVACGEIHGSPPELIERVDALLELPMHGRKESLNVSVAFGIAAYALTAQRIPDSLYLNSRTLRSERS